MQPVSLLVLTSEGCVHCHEFLTFWNKISEDWGNVTMREVSLLTEEGQQMVGEYRIFASPGIIINGELFDSGRFDAEEFLKKLSVLSNQQA